MAGNITTNCINGELKPGDLVLSSPDDYACLVGTVLSITKVGTPEHASETENDTDGVHVNFMDTEYSDKRIREIEDMFSDLYGKPMTYAECPIDDVIMSPDTLIRITDLARWAINDILKSRERAEIYCGIAMLGSSQRAEKAAEQPGFITEKLYSPLFVNMVEDENKEYYDENYWCDPIFLQRAAHYEDKIHESILRERHPDEKERGLMGYYGDGGSVDEKVRSLFVDVEVHDGKLWGVATIELAEPLTQDELAELKDYLTGQYSDGFGEGYEQRGFRVDDGELYVSLWDSNDKFFIDSAQEFERRLGIKLPALEQTATVPETPADAPLHEPDTGEDKATATLREQLTSRLDMNLSGYIDTIRHLDDRGIMDWSWEIAARMDAYHYLTELHSFQTPELEYLLKFKDPLQVVADAFGAANDLNRSDIMWKIINDQDALEGDYELMPETPDADVLSQPSPQSASLPETPAQTALHEPDVMEDEATAELYGELVQRLDANLAAHVDGLREIDEEGIVESSLSIASICGAHHYLTSMHNFHASEINYLLQFKDPLQVVADEFLLDATTSSRSDITWKIFHEQEALKGSYERISDDPAHAGPEQEKPAGNGYVICVTSDSASYMPGVKHIARDDSMSSYPPDTEAVKAAEMDGVKLIYGMPDVPDGIYIDTPENHAAITDYFEWERTAMPADKELTIPLKGRLDANYSAYKAEILELSKEEIIGSTDIADVYHAYDYFRNEHVYTVAQAEFLLEFANPLEFLSDRWNAGLEYVQRDVSKIFRDQEPPRDSGEKPSVLDQIRNATKPPKQTHKVKPVSRKKEPEL